MATKQASVKKKTNHFSIPMFAAHCNFNPDMQYFKVEFDVISNLLPFEI